ncbi:hypothetical protein CALVIDRAFT_155523 [Calocera viscosa TUFC12733]|uniref:DUF1776-domain-containing protein n=1 Tax=Calocera viscosa (strain TUFC12733) TaxID=1330018 RepID=A0A167LP85_CALVF|nr:hypothetical protein CALVIDRAFT_155523 [Calocera viscosa TUFC12733]
MPTIEELEEYIAEVENYIASLLPALETLPSLPQRIFDELQRFGPPSLPAFPTLTIQAPTPPPPPPPPPPPKGWSDWLGDLVGGGAMRKLTVGVVVSAGLGLASMYGYKRWRLHVLKKRKSRKLARTPLMTDGHRREAIVVLGADHPLGQPICASLEKQGYIVIATASSPSYASKLAKSSASGYLRALPLEPAAPVLLTSQSEDTASAFSSKLQVALSQTFPTTASGDPYVSAQHLPYVTGVISLMSLPTPAPMPIAHLPMKDQYLPYMVASHFTPVMLLQSLLPIMHRSPLGRTPRIIALVPALSSLPGTPFSAASSASTQATMSMLSSLRRELAQAHDATKIITLNVGTIALPTEGFEASLPPEAKEAYGSAFEAAMASAGRRTWSNPNRVTRVIEKILRLSDTPIGTALYWIKAGNVNVGAGGEFSARFELHCHSSPVANIYAAFARLPAPVLDVLFAIPSYVATLRARLSFIPRVRPAFVCPSFRRKATRAPEKEEKKPLAIEPAPVPVPPPAPVPAVPAAPVAQEVAAAAGVPVHDEALSEPESDLSIEEHEHSGSESEWEKVREGGEASRVETPAPTESVEASQAWRSL